MGIPVLILGESGSGKSTSLRNFKKNEIGIINVSKKPLPFRSDIAMAKTDVPNEIAEIIIKAKTKSIAVDDAQYIMANEFMRTAKQTGYQKFTDIALHFWQLVQIVINNTPDDVIVYFMAHIETDVNGREKMKTIGKMLDEKITVEGMFTIVLKTQVNDRQYKFVTQTNGMDTVKSPMGMFDDLLIDNDLKFVDETIRDFYDIKLNSKGENK